METKWRVEEGTRDGVYYRIVPPGRAPGWQVEIEGRLHGIYTTRELAQREIDETVAEINVEDARWEFGRLVPDPAEDAHRVTVHRGRLRHLLRVACAAAYEGGRPGPATDPVFACLAVRSVLRGLDIDDEAIRPLARDAVTYEVGDEMARRTAR